MSEPDEIHDISDESTVETFPIECANCGRVFQAIDGDDMYCFGCRIGFED